MLCLPQGLGAEVVAGSAGHTTDVHVVWPDLREVPLVCTGGTVRAIFIHQMGSYGARSWLRKVVVARVPDLELGSEIPPVCHVCVYIFGTDQGRGQVGFNRVLSYELERSLLVWYIHTFLLAPPHPLAHQAHPVWL